MFCCGGAFGSGMNERFGHSIVVHIVGLGAPPILGWLAFRSTVEPCVLGGGLLRIGLVAGCAALALVVGWLYLRSGIQSYLINEDAVAICRWWPQTRVPWADIRRMDWLAALHVVVVRGPSSVVLFTSTDFFPRVADLFREIHQRSECKLSPGLERLLYRCRDRL